LEPRFSSPWECPWPPAAARYGAAELLLYVVAALTSSTAELAVLVALILAAPFMYLVLWKWAGLMLDTAEQRASAPESPANGSVRAFKPAVVRGLAV